ncbi:FGGY-family carbohydrate kinase [Paenibacillus kribbensis]|uniref:FGGY-family carbohydrate kinase n=1 Tax=Paenibacillus kribbensis TaxID=172713 RepID=UPI000837DF15|nr:FGGY-family carbohydrate kinase [Paenibacillus kribbensis]
MAIAGIDIGTTGCKCTVYDREGHFLSEVYREYKNGMTENYRLDPSLVWDNTKTVLREAAKGVEPITAIGVTSFGEAVVLLDGNDKPLTYSMLYTDPSGGEQCERLVRHFGKENLSQITGLNPSPMYSIPKIMYIKETQPELFKQCEKVCLFGDFIIYMLCGVLQIDYSLASRTMAFDINFLEWSESILKFAGIDSNLLPNPVQIGSKAGKIRKGTALELGIWEEAVIVSGCHDQVAAAIGTGVYKAGMAVDGTGTVECITPVFGRDTHREPLYRGSYAIVPFLDRQFVTYAFSFTGGALLKWYRDKLAFVETDTIRKLGANPYDFFNGQVDASKPSGLLVLPHFAGAATPYMDPESRGAIIGLTTETTRMQIYQALMEGVTYEMALNMERLSEAGIEIHMIRATGGGAASDVWLQMKADILNKPIVSLRATQSGTLGCIMLAGLACELYESIEEAEQIFVKVNRTYTPNPDKHEQYKKWLQKYKKCYDAVKTVLKTKEED